MQTITKENVAELTMDFINRKLKGINFIELVKAGLLDIKDEQHIEDRIEEIYYDLLEEFAESLETNAEELYMNYKYELYRDKFAFIVDMKNEFLKQTAEPWTEEDEKKFQENFRDWVCSKKSYIQWAENKAKQKSQREGN